MQGWKRIERIILQLPTTFPHPLTVVKRPFRLPVLPSFRPSVPHPTNGVGTPITYIHTNPNTPTTTR